MSKFIIKELEKKDFENYEGFFETLENLRSTEDLNLDEAKEILEKINHQDSHVFIAVMNNKIVGATTLFVEQKFIRKGGKVGHIEDVVTRKNYEKKGIGKSVLKKAIEYARIRGCYKIILDCKDELISFYEKVGFRKVENEMRLDL